MSNRRILRPLNRQLNQQVELLPIDSLLFHSPKAVERWTYNLDGQSVDRTIIYLRSDVGCEFARKTGGCTGCRHSVLGTAGERIDGVHIRDMYKRQFDAAIESHGYSPVMCLYNEGNILNERELPRIQLKQMLRQMADNGVQRVVLESRVDYIRAETLGELCDAAGSMELEIGIGLESRSDFIRNELFLKEMSIVRFERAIETLRSFQIRSLAYAVVKPAFLNEAQAIFDATNTTKFAFGSGVDAVSLEPIGVEPNTIAEALFQQGDFQPCWLWSVIEVARETHALGELRIGGCQYKPRPKHLASNCEKCNGAVLDAIDRYNSSYDFAELSTLDCECKQVHLELLQHMTTEICEEQLRMKLSAFVDEATGCGVSKVQSNVVKRK